MKKRREENLMQQPRHPTQIETAQKFPRFPQRRQVSTNVNKLLHRRNYSPQDTNVRFNSNLITSCQFSSQQTQETQQND